MTMPPPSRATRFEAAHEPVLEAEVVRWMAPRANGCYVDCTLGAGGHARALVAAGAGQVIGLDRDTAALDETRRHPDGHDRIELVHGDYRDLPAVLDARGITVVDGIVADLGVSSLQLDDAERGFSFRREGQLDMRMDRSTGPTLAERLADVDLDTLTEVIRDYGEERHARRVAQAILRARDRGALQTTTELAAAVRSGVARRGWQRIDPATRTFQGLRIWLNDELSRLEAFLGEAADRLAGGGRLVVIAFHSLEDRIVKHTFRRLAQEHDTLRVLTKKPVRPDDSEQSRNPRSRSARLRVLEKAA